MAILIILSILNMLSVGFYKEDLFSVKKHIIIMGIALGTALVPAVMSYQVYRKPFMKGMLFLLSIGILIFIIIGPKSIVKTVNGASGWINLGITTVQPAEILKIPFIILLANVLAKGEEKNLPAKTVVFNSALIFGIFAILICRQNDLGTVIHYGAIYIFMLFLTRIDKKIITGTVAIGGILAAAGSYFIVNYGDKIDGGYKVAKN